MAIDPLIDLIANVGFPIGVAIWLLIGLPKLTERVMAVEHKQDRIIQLLEQQTLINEVQAGIRPRRDLPPPVAGT